MITLNWLLSESDDKGFSSDKRLVRNGTRKDDDSDPSRKHSSRRQHIVRIELLLHSLHQLTR